MPMAKSRCRCPLRSRLNAVRREAFLRRLSYEPLEDRQMLSISSPASWETLGSWYLDSNTPVDSYLLYASATPDSGTAGLTASLDSSRAQGDLSTLASAAPTISWIGIEGNWSNPANWDMGRVPAYYDTVSIPLDVAVVHISGQVKVTRHRLQWYPLAGQRGVDPHQRKPFLWSNLSRRKFRNDRRW